jgi:hypothetical protein
MPSANNADSVRKVKSVHFDIILPSSVVVVVVLVLLCPNAAKDVVTCRVGESTDVWSLRSTLEEDTDFEFRDLSWGRMKLTPFGKLETRVASQRMEVIDKGYTTPIVTMAIGGATPHQGTMMSRQCVLMGNVALVEAEHFVQKAPGKRGVRTEILHTCRRREIA